jgi:fatty acid desaturase
MNTATAEAHDDDDHPAPHWVSRAAFPLVTLALLATQAALLLSLQQGWMWLTVPLVLVASHLMHGQLIGFHEASHGLLRKSRRLNEIDGVLIGVFSFMSFSLYRASHQTHHMHLGTERDEELWPFVDTTKPRWMRVLAAFLELFVGLVFTPLIFLRTFLRKNSPIRAKKVRRRIWMEFALIVIAWTAIYSVVALLGLWKYFLWMYFFPAFIAANLQSWRKYIEHVGLTGSTVRSATRSIVSDTVLGRVVSFTLLHEPYHGVHHQRGGIGHAELPFHAADLEPTHPDEHPPFPSYSHAFVHLLRCLADPRVGAQWRQVETSPPQRGEREELAAAD